MLYPTVVLAVTVLISLMLWDAVSFGEKLIYRSSNFILLTSAAVSAGLSFSSFFIDEFVPHRNLFLITGYSLLVIAVAIFILLFREKTYSDKITSKTERSISYQINLPWRLVDADDDLRRRYRSIMKEFPNDKSEAQRNLMQEEARSLASDLRSAAGQLGNSRAHEGSNDISTLQLWAAKAALIGYGKSSPHLVRYEHGLRYYTRLPQYQDWAEDYAIFEENSDSIQASEFINPSRGGMDEKFN